MFFLLCWLEKTNPITEGGKQREGILKSEGKGKIGRREGESGDNF
jgi:hypothetical protein